LHAVAQLSRRGKDENVMLLGGRQGVVVEVINDKTGSVGRDGDF
jgi:hypothetical protein